VYEFTSLLFTVVSSYLNYLVRIVRRVVAWLSSNAVGYINKVTVRLARLVLGWVTVFGFSSRCGTFIS